MVSSNRQTRREELIEWLDDNSCYPLNFSPENSRLDKLSKAQVTIIELDNILEEAVERIKKLTKQRQSGLDIGDTSVDECIADVFFHLLHYGKKQD